MQDRLSLANMNMYVRLPNNDTQIVDTSRNFQVKTMC